MEVQGREDSRQGPLVAGCCGGPCGRRGQTASAKRKERSRRIHSVVRS